MSREMKLGRDIYGYALEPDREFKVVPYDFKRPDKFSKEQIRTLSLACHWSTR
jgi:flagellar motor switch protein FliM